MSCLHILEISPLSAVSFAIIFSHSGSYPFILFIAFFAVQMILSLIGSHCLFLFLFPLLQEVGQRGSCCNLCQRVFCLCFPLRVLQFQFTLLCGVRTYSNLILLYAAVQFSQYHLLKRLPFIHCLFLPPMSKISCPQVCRFTSGLSIVFH